MCFSAAVSYGATAVLIPTGLYAFRQARPLQPHYWVMALIPIFFGIQQSFEGRVWQLVEAGDAAGAVPFALAFHFFSHFLWLWWIPLSSVVVESQKMRKGIFLGIAIFGFAAGGLVYGSLLLNSHWLSVEVEKYSIIYDISAPPGPIDLKIPPSALYGLIILVPLLFSSHRHIKIFGGLVALSIVVASLAYGYAFVSVWCFFAALLSIYFVFMIRTLSSTEGSGGSAKRQLKRSAYNNPPSAY